MWTSLVELVRAAIFGAAHLCGGNVGAGVALVSFALRIALIPLTLRAARRARETQAKLAGLKPTLDRLRARHAKEPQVLARGTMARYKIGRAHV